MKESEFSMLNIEQKNGAHMLICLRLYGSLFLGIWDFFAQLWVYIRIA